MTRPRDHQSHIDGWHSRRNGRPNRFDRKDGQAELDRALNDWPRARAERGFAKLGCRLLNMPAHVGLRCFRTRTDTQHHNASSLRLCGKPVGSVNNMGASQCAT